MRRRDFLKLAALGSLSGCSTFPWPPPELSILRPGMAFGHRLREAYPLPEPDPARTRTCDTVIIGSGAAGLFAGWRLAQQGHKDFLLISGPEFYGNAASGRFGDIAYPQGAHYLPLPSMESTHVREMLSAFGVIHGDPFSERPQYDEAVIVHAPEERLLKDGTWQEGLVPSQGISAEAREQIARFLGHMAQMRDARGSDGRRAFAIPLVSSSGDAQFTSLDGESFAQWLQRNRYTAQELLWYTDYCCRDDYGAGITEVSAWAGIHYFASRGGHAANAEEGAVLTWPEGLNAVARRLAAAVGPARTLPGMAIRVREQGRGVEVICVDVAKATVFAFKARRAIVAVPLHVAFRLVEGLAGEGLDAARDLPPTSPWMVSNFLLDGFPRERDEGSQRGEHATHMPLAWDNVVYDSRSLGWVVATHQWIRQAKPERTVFTAYHAFAGMTPSAARQWMLSARQDEMLALASGDLVDAYGHCLWRHVRKVEITLRGHAMTRPAPGFLSRAAIHVLRERDGAVLFAHADLSGLSVFEEAAWWGDVAARKILGV